MAFRIPDLDAFGLSRTKGFLSNDPPLLKFSNSHYEKWDRIFENLSELIYTHKLADEVSNLPILSISKLSSELDFRRAYLVLAFLVHGYVWGGSNDGTAIEAIPPQLSEPFLAACEKVGMAPVLSYAGLCIWNWTAKDDANSSPEGTFFELEQLKSLGSFTGTRGEDAFYHVPVMMEAEGGPLIALLLEAVAAAQKGDTSIVTAALNQGAATLVRLGVHMSKLYPALDAQMFFHELRPFIAGSKGKEEQGLPRGMVFQNSDGSEMAVKYAGGNAGQSSLFQFLDYVLGVEHEGPGEGRESFFEEMRLCMPGKHREFLEAVSQLPSLRTFVEKNQSDASLAAAYENCMSQLRSWRAKHIAVVSKYIVRPARQVARNRENGGPETSEEGSGVVKDEDIKGTGGSALIPFLKQARDETIGLHLPS